MDAMFLMYAVDRDHRTMMPRGDELHDFLTLMVTFIGEPRYVKNPYLRATFTKVRVRVRLR